MPGGDGIAAGLPFVAGGPAGAGGLLTGNPGDGIAGDLPFPAMSGGLVGSPGGGIAGELPCVAGGPASPGGGGQCICRLVHPKRWWRRKGFMALWHFRARRPCFCDHPRVCDQGWQVWPW